MQERRKQREVEIEMKQAEKEKERLETARMKEKEREERIAALNAQQQAHIEELKVKIQQKVIVKAFSLEMATSLGQFVWITLELLCIRSRTNVSGIKNIVCERHLLVREAFAKNPGTFRHGVRNFAK
jgi:hypothetical protein